MRLEAACCGQGPLACSGQGPLSCDSAVQACPCSSLGKGTSTTLWYACTLSGLSLSLPPSTARFLSSIQSRAHPSSLHTPTKGAGA